MRLIETREIAGSSGTPYAMNVYPADMRFNDFIAGVFVLMDGDQQAIFLGQSDNVDFFLQKNEVLSRFESNGFHRIGFIKNGSPEVRGKIVADLSRVLNPTVAEI